MRACPSCGQPIQKASVFCGACGAKVPTESLPTTPHASVNIQDHVDPLASTAPASRSPAFGMDRAPPARPSSEGPVSPMAETAFELPPDRATPPAAPLPTPRGKTVPLSAMPNPKGVARPSAPGAPPAAVPASPGSPWVVGARVAVQWANGQRYPGTVERVNGPQCLVRFDAGERRWVESRFVLPLP